MIVETTTAEELAGDVDGAAVVEADDVTAADEELATALDDDAAVEEAEAASVTVTTGVADEETADTD